MREKLLKDGTWELQRVDKWEYVVYHRCTGRLSACGPFNAACLLCGRDVPGRMQGMVALLEWER